ncbi:MAG: hypothetical protein JXR70_07740 [Spirochaetales bacterium]|nr:hypothetical protein [Spirochaetales bacterium]
MFKNLIQFLYRNREGIVTSILAGLLSAAILGIPSIFSREFRSLLISIIGFKLFDFVAGYVLFLPFMVFIIYFVTKQKIIHSRNKTLLSQYNELQKLNREMAQLKQDIEFKNQEKEKLKNRIDRLNTDYIDKTSQNDEQSPLKPLASAEEVGSENVAPVTNQRQGGDIKYFRNIQKQLSYMRKYLQNEIKDNRQYSNYDIMIPFINKHLGEYVDILNELYSEVYKKSIFKIIELPNVNVLRESSPTKKFNRICQNINGMKQNISNIIFFINEYIKYRDDPDNQGDVNIQILKDKILKRWMAL